MAKFEFIGCGYVIFLIIATEQPVLLVTLVMSGLSPLWLRHNMAVGMTPEVTSIAAHVHHVTVFVFLALWGFVAYLAFF